MMLVTESFEYCRTRFHTLITSPQVVSTNRQPFSSSFRRVATSVPKAGIITMSSGRSWLISSSPGLPAIVTIPRRRIWSFTSGVWIDLAKKKDAPLGISPAGRVGKVNGPLDAVAKAEFLRELDGKIARRE